MVAVNMKKLLTVLCLMTSLQWQQCFASTLTWTSPVTISTPGVDASDPQIKIDVNGNATSVWVENNFIQASHLPSGGSWGTITTISNTGASSPHLGIDTAGNVTAIWLENGVVSSAALPAGGSWSAETAISSTGASSLSTYVDRSGNAVAIWVRGGFIETAQKPFGSIWGTVSRLSSTGVETSPDVFIGSSGTMFAVWHTVSSGADIIDYAKGSVGGSWGTSAHIITAAPALHHNFPKVVVDQNGNATAAWYRYNLSGSVYSNTNVLASTLQSGSSSWGIPVLLSQAGLLNVANFNFIKLQIDTQGDVNAEWVNSSDGDTFIIEVAVLPFSGSWQGIGGALDIGDPYAYQATQSVASTGDTVSTYMFFDGTNLNIQAVETSIQGIKYNFFTPPVNISQGTDNAYPRVSAQTLGTTMNAASVWQQFNGTNKVVQAATGSKSLVLPPSSPMVIQTPNNFGVFSTFTNTLSWNPSPDPDVIEYIIYRNNIPIATVPASVLQYVDYNAPMASGSITYGVSAFNNVFQVSQIVTVVE
jgi:hypothetical protein